MVRESVVRLQEYSNQVTRLAIPASYRDELGLSHQQSVSITAECRGDTPTLVLETSPENVSEVLTRPIRIGSNNQARLNFPRQVAEAFQLLNEDLELNVDETAILLQKKG